METNAANPVVATCSTRNMPLLTELSRSRVRPKTTGAIVTIRRVLAAWFQRRRLGRAAPGAWLPGE
jgi:hypothetical protein